MKKNRFTEFFKGKGYFVLLFVGVIAIATVAVMGSQLSSEQNSEDNNIVDLNETDDNIAAKEDDTLLTENNPVSEGIVNKVDNSSNDTVTKDSTGQNVANKEDLIEYEGYSEDTTGDVAEVATNADSVKNEVVVPDTEEAAGTTVQAQNPPVNLSFNKEDGLSWPVKGDVIMNYSMEHTIYHATLMQYKCNPAIIIGAEVGTKVKAAAKGIISGIETYNEETGLTVTVNIGDGYSVVYGQLRDVTLKVGDKVSEGDVIGVIEEPSKYYSVEGSNLYFKVLDKEETVNPMLLLR